MLYASKRSEDLNIKKLSIAYRMICFLECYPIYKYIPFIMLHTHTHTHTHTYIYNCFEELLLLELFLADVFKRG